MSLGEKIDIFTFTFRSCEMNYVVFSYFVPPRSIERMQIIRRPMADLTLVITTSDVLIDEERLHAILQSSELTVTMDRPIASLTDIPLGL